MQQTSKASQPSLDTNAIASLRQAITGCVTTPDDPDYDRLRAVWNGMIDRYPAVIVSCASVDDIITALDMARKHELVVAGDGEGQDAELLWGLRGGGGNFGIVTRFTFQLHPIGPEAYFAFVYHDGEGEATERTLRFFRDFCDAAPATVNPLAVCGVVP